MATLDEFDDLEGWRPEKAFELVEAFVVGAGCSSDEIRLDEDRVLDGCTLEELGDVAFCPFEAVVDVTLGPVDDCVVEDTVGRGFGIEVDWLLEGADDVLFDTGADGVIGCPSNSDDVVTGTEEGCAPDEIVELVPGTRVDNPPDCISEDEIDVDDKVGEASELVRVFGRPLKVLVNEDEAFSPDVGDTGIVGDSCADDKVDEVCELEPLFGRPFAVLANEDVEFSPEAGEEAGRELCELEGCSVTTLV
ncbi:hypothetical protein KC331_g14467 [Hortaea werneckii]|nr:hypothetical protein KC331_g14467 [Hortaea werneckii]